MGNTMAPGEQRGSRHTATFWPAFATYLQEQWLLSNLGGDGRGWARHSGVPGSTGVLLVRVRILRETGTDGLELTTCL